MINGVELQYPNANQSVIQKAKNKPHYVDNKKFLLAMTEYRDKCKKAEEKGRKKRIEDILY